MIALGPAYHKRPNSSASEIRSTPRLRRQGSQLKPPINHALGSPRHWSVPLGQQSGQNWKVPHRIVLRAVTVLEVDDVCRGMLGKILFERFPRVRHDPVDVEEPFAEHMTGERNRMDEATSGAPSSFKINCRLIAPDENPIIRS